MDVRRKVDKDIKECNLYICGGHWCGNWYFVCCSLHMCTTLLVF